jgi:hypothetical protein
MIRVRARSARARLALAACVLWLAGVEVMPALHEAMHGQLAPHRHDNGSIVTVSFADTTHRHPDGSIHFVASGSRTTGKPARDGRPRATAGTDHADGLAHHAAALAPPAPPVTQPLPIDRRPSSQVVARSIELVTRDPLAAAARGPPIAV